MWSMTDDMPMCETCGAILDDDGACPDIEDHGAALLALWIERQSNTELNFVQEIQMTCGHPRAADFVCGVCGADVRDICEDSA